MIKIGIDIDSVIGASMNTLIIEAKRVHNINVNPEDIYNYAIWDWTRLSKEQCNEFFNDPLYLCKILPVPYAETTISRLADNLRIYYVTSRPQVLRPETTSWLYEHGFLRGNVIFKEDKAKFALENNLSYFVEDRYKITLELAEVCKAVFLMDHPWNRRPVPGNVFRVKNWMQIMTYFHPETITRRT